MRPVSPRMTEPDEAGLDPCEGHALARVSGKIDANFRGKCGDRRERLGIRLAPEGAKFA